MSEKNHQNTITKKNSALTRHPALLCFILVLLGSIYSGDTHLLNFRGLFGFLFVLFVNVFKPQGRVISLNIILLI